MTDDKEIYSDTTRFERDIFAAAMMIDSIIKYSFQCMIEEHRDTTDIKELRRSIAATLGTWSRFQPHKLRGLIRVLRTILGKIPPDKDSRDLEDVSVEDYLTELYSQIKLKEK